MVILRSQNKITDFLIILAWASPFKASFHIPVSRLIFKTTKGFRMKISMKLVFQLFLIIHLPSSHLHPLQVENYASNSRLVVDEDYNGEVRLKRVKDLLLIHVFDVVDDAEASSDADSDTDDSGSHSSSETEKKTKKKVKKVEDKTETMSKKEKKKLAKKEKKKKKKALKSEDDEATAKKKKKKKSEESEKKKEEGEKKGKKRKPADSDEEDDDEMDGRSPMLVSCWSSIVDGGPTLN